MSEALRKVSAPQEPRGRLISIFVGAVLLPTVALSYLSIDLVPKLASETRSSLTKRAEKNLYFLEQELRQAGEKRATEAARLVGTERLLDGRREEIDEALAKEGLGWGVFESLHLEAAPAHLHPMLKESKDANDELPREVLRELEDDEPRGSRELEVLFWPGEAGEGAGVLRYRFTKDYVREKLVREYFEKFTDQSLVVRVADRAGRVVYETAPTPDGKFEVKREMESPSFGGLVLHLRYKEHSIEQDVRRWELGTLALIGFIDIMLCAGLYLVYSNVRQEIHLARLKSDFVANVSHELKTPLALIRLFAETLELGRVPTEDKARQYYRVINKESQRLTQLINNILDFSRIEAGRREYHFSPTDVAKVVDDVIDAYRFPIEQQGFTLDLDVPHDLPPVEADQEALSQALLNLVNNAMKYSREEKYIALRARQDGERVILSVTDHGIGVGKGEHGKIFEKFYRGEDSLVHETKGSGLGLSLVRHIMEAHGGSVVVESAPGKGSVFTLVLPIGKKAA